MANTQILCTGSAQSDQQARAHLKSAPVAELEMVYMQPPAPAQEDQYVKQTACLLAPLNTTRIAGFLAHFSSVHGKGAGITTKLYDSVHKAMASIARVQLPRGTHARIFPGHKLPTSFYQLKPEEVHARVLLELGRASLEPVHEREIMLPAGHEALGVRVSGRMATTETNSTYFILDLSYETYLAQSRRGMMHSDDACLKERSRAEHLALLATLPTGKLVQEAARLETSLSTTGSTDGFESFREAMLRLPAHQFREAMHSLGNNIASNPNAHFSRAVDAPPQSDRKTMLSGLYLRAFRDRLSTIAPQDLYDHAARLHTASPGAFNALLKGLPEHVQQSLLTYVDAPHHSAEAYNESFFAQLKDGEDFIYTTDIARLPASEENRIRGLPPCQ